MHFIGDYFHYDNKFWQTIKTLVLKPGQITLEYIQGKRVKYLNPIQLYIFVTTVFFIIAFSSSSKEPKITKTSNDNIDTISNIESKKASTKMNNIIDEEADDIMDEDSSSIVDTDTNNLTKKDTKDIKISITEKGITANGAIGIGDFTPTEKTLYEYDSTQKALPEAKQDGLVNNLLKRKALKIGEEYKGDFNKLFLDKFKHNVPKIFFILLPFFALLLSSFFYRKKMYYVDHLIFSIHFHSLLFIGLIAIFSLSKLIINENFISCINLVFFLSIGMYLFLALRKVYPSRWWVILLKQILLFFTYCIGFIFTGIVVSLAVFLLM
jgi:hypothetical protein